MIISVHLPDVLTAAGIVVSVVLAGAKLLLHVVQKNFNERFGALDEQAKNWGRLEREFLRFKADMPINYVRREDYVRGQSVIEAKLDAIAGELKRVQIDGAQQGIRYDN